MRTAVCQVVLGLVVNVRVVEERLGGNAAHVEAGASELAPLLNADRLDKAGKALESSTKA